MIEILQRSKVVTGTNEVDLARQLPNFPTDIEGQVAYLAITFFDCATVPIFKASAQNGTPTDQD